MGKPTLVESNEITIVDIGKIDGSTDFETNEDILKISEDLKEAFSHRKVVYIINHGISDEEVKKIYSLMSNFFALPEEVKEKYKSQGRKDFHGYLAQNSEQFYERNKFEIRESFNVVGKNRPFPNEEIPEFEECCKEITNKFLTISNLLLKLFSISMGADADFLTDYHKNMMNHLYNTTIFRVLHYPPIKEEPHPGIIRCNEHTDYGTFTLLLQDSEGGLEIRGEDGKWKRVGHLPGAIFLNSADLLDWWSSGIYKSTVHRVVVPEERENRLKSRNSMAFFVQPDHSVTVRPVKPPSGIEVKECNAGEYIGNLFDRADKNINSIP